MFVYLLVKKYIAKVNLLTIIYQILIKNALSDEFFCLADKFERISSILTLWIMQDFYFDSTENANT